MDVSLFGEKLKQARKEAKLTRKEVGKMAHCSSKTVRNAEVGLKIKSTTARNLAECFECSRDLMKAYFDSDFSTSSGNNRFAFASELYAYWKPYTKAITKKTLFWEYHMWWVQTYKEGLIRWVTLNKYKICNRYLKENFGSLTLDKINRTTFQTIINSYGADHDKTTVADFLNEVRPSLRDAVYEGLLKKDPCYGVVIKGRNNKHKTKKFLSEGQLSDLLSVLDYSDRPDYAWLIYLLAKTGFRFAEAMALTPKDFDFEKTTISVNKTLNYKDCEKGLFLPTKNRSSVRTINADFQTMTHFQRLVQGCPDDYPIFLWGINALRIHNSTVNRYLQKKCEKAGVPVIRVHSLRHTHASVLIANGVSMISISKRLGHANLTTTQNVYSHITDELAMRDNLVMESALASIGGGF